MGTRVRVCPWRQEKDISSLGGSKHVFTSCPVECWDVNSSPFMEQQALLTTKTSLQPLLWVDSLHFFVVSFM